MMKRGLIFALILSVIVATGCALPSALPPRATNTPLATITQDTDTSNWQTYTNSEAGFGIQYPPDWTEEQLPDQNAGLMKSVALTGPEGVVELYWGTGFGGACRPEGYQPVKVAQGELSTCHVKNSNGTEHWELICKNLSAMSFCARAYTKNAEPESRDVVLKVISTLSFQP